MPTPHDPQSSAVHVSALVERVRRRLAARDGLRALALAIGTAGALPTLARSLPLQLGSRAAFAAGLGGVMATVLMVGRRRLRTRRAAAHLIERRYRSLRNLAITGEELLADASRTPSYMRDRVLQDAARAMAGIDPARVVPLTRSAGALVVAVLVLALIMPYARRRSPAEKAVPQTAGGAAVTAAGDVTIDVAPPDYSGRPTVHLTNPRALEALAGSIATLRVAGVSAPAVRINGVTIGTHDGAVRATLTDSGYVAIDGGGAHHLLPLNVTADAAPDVRVTAPAKDLRLADAKAAIAIRAAASDDLGLKTLDLRYTIVSGGGEQFTFSEGTLPASIARDSPRSWRADAVLSLAALKLEPGDALIYRAVAADARPGGGEASSDTYFIEIAGPGDVPLEGVEMPPDKERYALSEAMVVVKIQRLLAAESGMRRPEVEAAAANIAAEQRAVRANFVFLLGGEVEDEVVEAEASHEIQEGRLANQARKEIVAATVLMAKVEQALAAVSPRTALPLAQEAVRALQRAFGHSRYLLRALPARIRIDPTRRLAGDVAAVRDWRRGLVSPEADPQIEGARRAMRDLAAIAADPRATDASVTLARLAERVLAIAPGDSDLQNASRALVDAGVASARGDVTRGRAALESAATLLLKRAQRRRLDLSPVDADALRLAGAAALENGGGR
jgi:hypothetical protein